jgi:hypothetical protein
MSYLPIDLQTSEIKDKRRLKTSTLDSFSGAGASGKSFARTIPITIAAGDSYSARFQKNSNVAVRFVRAKGLFIDAVQGTVSGDIVALDALISTNGVVNSDFVGSIEVFNNEASGDVVLGAFDELTDSFYPDGQFVIDLRNPSDQDVNTFLSVGVEQVSAAGVYSILEPNTQLEANTEMSQFNGTN